MNIVDAEKRGKKLS